MKIAFYFGSIIVLYVYNDMCLLVIVMTHYVG